MKEDKLKVICPFCNEQFITEMMIELEDKGFGCETCYSPNPSAKVEIQCDNCKKIVYVKEISGYQ